MASMLLGVALFLTSHGPGRGEDPSGAGGVLIVVGIALAAVLTAIAALFLVVRLLRARRESDRTARTEEGPLPSEQGRPWSSER